MHSLCRSALFLFFDQSYCWSKAAVIIYSSHKEKDLSHYPEEAWDKSVWDFSSCLIDGQPLFLFHFSDIAHSQIILCRYSTLCPGPLAPPFPFRQAHARVYHCFHWVLHLLSIIIRDRLMDDYQWRSKCLSLAPGSSKLKQGWRQRTRPLHWLTHVGVVVVVVGGFPEERDSTAPERGQLQQSDWNKEKVNYFCYVDRSEGKGEAEHDGS